MTTGGHDGLSSSGYYLDLNYPARVHYAFDPSSGPDGLAMAEAKMLDEPRLANVRRGMQAVLSMAQTEPERLAPIPGRVLGGEAVVGLVTPELLDTRLYGRLAAVAERLWTDPARCDVDDFERRLPALLAHLEAHTDCRHCPVANRCCCASACARTNCITCAWRSRLSNRCAGIDACSARRSRSIAVRAPAWARLN